jgi:hypothetical protein
MNLVQRIMDITLKPKETWPVIKEEPATIRELYTNYVIPLSVIPPLASFLGFSLIGISMLNFTYRVPFFTGLSHAVVSYVLSLVGIYVVAQIIDALAPNFGSQKNLIKAFKVAVYSYTPSWVAGIVLIIPALSPLALLVSLYSLYLFYLGLPELMETPRDKVMGYFVVTLVVSVVVFIVIGIISRSLFGLGRMGAWM